jgi:hypothetical protein
MMRSSKKKQLTQEERYDKADAKERKKLLKRQKCVGSSSQPEAVPSMDTLEDFSPQPNAQTFADGPVYVSEMSADADFARSVPTELNWLDPKFRSTTSNFATCIRPVLMDESLVVAYETKINDFISKDLQAMSAIADFNLTPLEASCIIIFTMSASDALPDRRSEGRSFYRAYNTALSGRDTQRIRDFSEYSHHLKRGLDKLPRACAPGGAVTLYRGLDRSASPAPIARPT